MSFIILKKLLVFKNTVEKKINDFVYNRVLDVEARSSKSLSKFNDESSRRKPKRHAKPEFYNELQFVEQSGSVVQPIVILHFVERVHSVPSSTSSPSVTDGKF